MVDSVTSATGQLSSLLRAQTTLASLNTNLQSTQKLIDQLSNGAKPSTVQPSVKTAGPNEELPRGSLVDILA